MQKFMKYKDQRAAQLEQHRFIQWLDADNVSPLRKLDFAPIMAIFVMNFRDMNLWVLRFDERSDEHFRGIINGNTYEDESHSRLFLEDWDKLALDDKLGWSAGDTLWWLFASEATECFRRYGIEFIKLCVEDGGDPMVRFTHSEAGEACGHVFFRHVVHPTAQLADRTGMHYRYFGHYHLDRELGHVMHSEGEFENQILDEETRAHGLVLGERMFNIFDGIFDAFADYARDYVERGSVPVPPVAAMASLPRHAYEVVSGSREPEARPEVRPEVKDNARSTSEAASYLQGVLDERMNRARQHPFYRWLREADVDAADKLRRFIPMWVMDIMGYRDLNHYVFHYEHPRGRLERLINAWVNDLETHSELFFADWRALDMDERLGWGARETLEFCFFDPGMDVHRENIVRFAQMGLSYPEPVLRFWLMHALQASGEAFFDNTRELAHMAEKAGVGRLDYLADRHQSAHREPERDRAEALRAEFMAESLTSEQIAIAERMIEVVFDALQAQLDLSLHAATSDRFRISARSSARTPHAHDQQARPLPSSTGTAMSVYP